MTAANPLRPTSDLRLAAIDLDGTLLGPDLAISPENRRAVAQLEAAGLAVVLASGRHHTSIKPFADQLPGVQWIVSAQGGEVSDVTRTRILSQSFLTRAQVADAVMIRHEFAASALFYTPEGILTDAPSNEHVQFYSGLTGLVPRQVTVAELEPRSIYKVVWVASSAEIDAIASNQRIASVDVQQVRTHLRLFEFVPKDVSKATGLAALAQHLGLTARNVVAFGDADNDIPMFEWAARSIAMSHGWASAKARARQIAPPGPPESAFARAVDMLSAELAPGSAMTRT